MVEEAGTLPATDATAWSDALSELWQDPGMRARRGEHAIARVREEFGEDRYYERLIRLYDGVSP